MEIFKQALRSATSSFTVVLENLMRNIGNDQKLKQNKKKNSKIQHTSAFFDMRPLNNDVKKRISN